MCASDDQGIGKLGSRNGVKAVPPLPRTEVRKGRATYGKSKADDKRRNG